MPSIFILGLMVINKLSDFGLGVLDTLLDFGATEGSELLVGTGNCRVISGNGSNVVVGVTDGETVMV